MKLKELLEVLPDDLDISVQHDECVTASLVRGIKTFNKLVDREVVHASPNFVHKVGIQSFNVKIV